MKGVSGTILLQDLDFEITDGLHRFGEKK